MFGVFFKIASLLLLLLYSLSITSQTANAASSSSGSSHKPRCYFNTGITIPDIPGEWRDWSAEWPEYETKFAKEHTEENLENSAGASGVDYEAPGSGRWYEVRYNRKSYEPGQYGFSSVTGRPQNPFGRTGIQGRGMLGRWGPNHCAETAVTRQRSGGNGELQLALFYRRSRNKERKGSWALPGGKRYPEETFGREGELVGLRRQFCEKALGGNNNNREEDIKYLDDNKFWESLSAAHVQFVYAGMGGSGGKKVEGKVNTDNAWVETVVYNFHDENRLFDHIRLADGAGWFTFAEIQGLFDAGELFSSHIPYIEAVAEIYGLKGYSVDAEASEWQPK